jgi:hypothetical protein
MLAVQQHNFEIHGMAPDLQKVREARYRLEDVLRRVLRPSGGCFNEADGKLLKQRISSHLRLAKAMLP